MINESGICCDCKKRDICNAYQKNPQVKVIDCQRFEMDEKAKEIYRAIAMFAIGACDDD